MAGTILLFALPGAAVVALGFTLYVSSMIRRGAFEPTRSIPRLDLEVHAVTPEGITLGLLDGRTGIPTTHHLTQEGIWGLRWDGGHGRLGQVLDISDETITRQFRAYTGTLRVGDHARIDIAAFPADPGAAFGLEFQAVEYESPAGQFTGALSEGSGSHWVLFVHGKRSARPNRLPHTYPILGLAAERNLPCLDVQYRNDVGAPSGDGLHWYGLREWEDLEAAARYAIDHGAERLIVVGYSMGGAIAVSFMYRSVLAHRVSGLILDAPVLDLESVINLGIGKRGVPRALVRPGLWLAARRLGVRWEWFDYLTGVEKLQAPILLFHGDSDPVVPVESSDRLSRLRPDLVTYYRVRGATHAHAWNVDPAGYEARVRAFLAGLV